MRNFRGLKMWLLESLAFVVGVAVIVTVVTHYMDVANAWKERQEKKDEEATRLEIKPANDRTYSEIKDD